MKTIRLKKELSDDTLKHLKQFDKDNELVFLEFLAQFVEPVYKDYVDQIIAFNDLVCTSLFDIPFESRQAIELEYARVYQHLKAQVFGSDNDK